MIRYGAKRAHLNQGLCIGAERPRTQMQIKQYPFQIPISDLPALVPGHPQALVPPLILLRTLQSLGEALHIYTLCHLFTIFFQTVLRGDMIIPLFSVMPHTEYSGRSRYQIKNCGRELSKSQSNKKFGRGSWGGWATHFADHQMTQHKQP